MPEYCLLKEHSSAQGQLVSVGGSAEEKVGSEGSKEIES